MTNNRLELGGPSTASAAPIEIDGTSQEECAQLRRQPIPRNGELQPLATNFPNRSQYTPPYTPSGSHAESTTFPLGEGAPVETEAGSLRPQVQAEKVRGNFPQTIAPFGQIDPSRTRKAEDATLVEYATENQPKDWDAKPQRRTDTTPSVHGSHSRTHSPTHSPPRGNTPVRGPQPRYDHSRHSQRRELEYAAHRHSRTHQPYNSRDGYLMRNLSPDTVNRTASKRGRSASPKSLMDDHEQIDNQPDVNRARSKSSSSISGIESRRESLTRSRSRDFMSTQVHSRRSYNTPPRMNTPPQSQWTDRPASPVNVADSPHHEENETLPTNHAEGQYSLASRLDIPQKKPSTPTTSQAEAEVPTTEASPNYPFGKMRSAGYGMDGRQTKRRLQDRINGNQTGFSNSKFGLRCPFSHKYNANDRHDKNQPHPGYTPDEWREVMECVQRVGYAPPHLTKEGCVPHPAFRPPENSQPRSHPLNPFSIPPAAQGTDRYIPPPTPPVPRQPPMAVPYPQTVPMPAPMPTAPFSSGPPPHAYPQHPGHLGASHVNPFDNTSAFGERPILKKRRTGPQGQFRPASGDYGSQQAHSDQWSPHSMPPPTWNQPPNNHPPAPRPSYTRQPHRPNTFHNQQGQPSVPPHIRRKRPYDQHE
jgi:hypothetical protein